MKKIAFAKINLSLDVLSKREDGYHNIDTIMVPITLGDEMIFFKREKGIEIQGMERYGEVSLKQNYIYRAWQTICRRVGKELGLQVQVTKRIPVAAGLAGGTSNGAQTFHAMNELYDLGFSLKELQEMALPLGADFPYMLQGSTARARGLGEKLERLDDFSGRKGLLVNPGYGISTASVYESLRISHDHPSLDLLVQAMRGNDVSELNPYLYNKMEESVFEIHPDLKKIKEELIQLGGSALMSGTGATVFALFDQEDQRAEAHGQMKKKYSYVECFETGEPNGSF